MGDYIFFGNEMSYFSGKARAYLRWKSIDFTEVAPSPDVMRSEILPHIGWPVIPVMKTPVGRYVQDTYDVMMDIERAQPAPAMLPSGALQRFASYLLQLFADEWLIIPSMHYRWNHNEDWVYGEFGRNAAPDAPKDVQYEAGKKAGQRFRGFVPSLGISDATIPGIEAAYEALLADLSAHLEAFPFMLGHRASFADFSMMGALYAHQYRDPASGALMKRLAPRVAEYVERTMAGDGRTGELLAEDNVPSTLLPVFARQMTEQLPVLIATSQLFAEWSGTAKPRAEVPRGLGMVPFTTGGASGECAARSFSLFRLQQALDCLDNLNRDEKARAEAFLSKVGGEALLAFSLPERLERRNYKLCLA